MLQIFFGLNFPKILSAFFVQCLDHLSILSTNSKSKTKKNTAEKWNPPRWWFFVYSSHEWIPPGQITFHVEAFFLHCNCKLLIFGKFKKVPQRGRLFGLGEFTRENYKHWAINVEGLNLKEILRSIIAEGFSFQQSDLNQSLLIFFRI